MARLGAITPIAQQVYTELLRFAGAEPASLYGENFLTTGASQWPRRLLRRFPKLALWRGISHLKNRLKRLIGVSVDTPIWLTNRTAQLMKLAATVTSRVCQNVLVADLNWPNYQRILENIRSPHPIALTRANIRHQILEQGMGRDELVNNISQTYFANCCDGLFLPAVDNLGIRLPIPEIVQSIEREAEIRFILVDGAQALCHVPLESLATHMDFFIAGSHKWLGGHHPMGIGVCGRQRWTTYIDDVKRDMTASYDLDDPLLALIDEFEQDSPKPFGETVMVAPLFTCQGAITDAQEIDASRQLSRRIQNADALIKTIPKTRWQPLIPDQAFRSGIMLVRSKEKSVRNTSTRDIRAKFNKAGLAVTAYARGLVRLSIPSSRFSTTDLDRISAAFEMCSSLSG